MSILGSILGGSVAQPIEAVGNVLDKLFTSDGEKLDKEAILTRLAQQPNLAQIELNKIEAQHRTIFVAGWRPFIGWVCGVALAYVFILRDLLAWGLTMYQVGDVVAPPTLAIEDLMTVLLALLGLGGLRTVEKLNGRAK
jgi:hypothetical protein